MKALAKAILTSMLLALTLSGCRRTSPEPVPGATARPVPPGVPEVQVPFASLRPEATWKIGETADWVAIAPDAVWVAGTKPDSVQRIDPRTNRVVASVPFARRGVLRVGVCFWQSLGAGVHHTDFIGAR